MKMAKSLCDGLLAIFIITYLAFSIYICYSVAKYIFFYFSLLAVWLSKSSENLMLFQLINN